MPKSARRVVVSRTVTFTTTIDIPGRPEISNADALTTLGGAAGTTGTLALGELLAGATTTNNGSAPRGDWSVTSAWNIEPYKTRPKSTALKAGERIAILKTASGNEAAKGKLYIVMADGTTSSSNEEAITWNTTNGALMSGLDNTVNYRVIPKFPTINVFANSGSYTLGDIVKPSTNSHKEFLVTSSGTNTAAASAPTWTGSDTFGATVASNTVQFTCITHCFTYTNDATYNVGDIVKPSGGSSEEWLVLTGGNVGSTGTAPSGGSVGTEVTVNGVKFKRVC